MSFVSKIFVSCQLAFDFVHLSVVSLTSSRPSVNNQASCFSFFVVGPDGPLKEKKEEVPPARRLVQCLMNSCCRKLKCLKLHLSLSHCEEKKSIKTLFRHQLCVISFEAIWAVLPDMN